ELSDANRVKILHIQFIGGDMLGSAVFLCIFCGIAGGISAGKVLDQRRFPCGRRAQYQDILHEKPSERPGDIIPVQYRLFPDACPADPEYLTVHHCDTRIDSAPFLIKEITEWIDILFLTYIKGHITHFEVQTIEN